AINRLIAAGLLRRAVRGGKGRHDTNRYMLPVELPAQFSRRQGRRKGGRGTASMGGADTALRSSLGRHSRAYKGGVSVPVRAAPVPPEPESNPLRNLREGANAPKAAKAARSPDPDFPSSARESRDGDGSPLHSRARPLHGKARSGSASSKRRRA